MKPLKRLLRVTGCLLLGAALLAGCAHRAPPTPTAPLLHDRFFAPPTEVVDKAAVFALSDSMLRYAAAELSSNAFNRDPRRALIDALYNRRQLGLSYDAGSTRNAAQAFDARAGNCLSLVIMTAAFAKHLGLPVSYQAVLVDELYTRTADLMLANGHVNLVLDKLNLKSTFPMPVSDGLVVDFLPGDELRGQRTRQLQERTIVAMYLNNRAAEALAQGRMADSYAWAREAVLEDPDFHAAANTLGVIYLRSGHLPEAETALRHVLALDAQSTAALSNLRTVLQRQGRSAEADAVGAQLLALQPYAPFHFFELGRQAMAAGEPQRASELFSRELRRQPYQHEVHFWAAQAHWRLGHQRQAADHLRMAMENSNTLSSHDLYAAKLDHLRALRLQ